MNFSHEQVGDLRSMAEQDHNRGDDSDGYSSDDYDGIYGMYHGFGAFTMYDDRPKKGRKKKRVWFPAVPAGHLAPADFPATRRSIAFDGDDEEDNRYTEFKVKSLLTRS